jgi:hypothetical protein
MIVHWNPILVLTPNSTQYVNMLSIPKPENSEDDSVLGPPPQRRDTESLSSRSEEDQNDLNLTQSFEYEIGVYCAGVSGDRRLVLSEGKPPAYFVRNSIFRPGIPDVTIFAGSDKSGAVIGVCMYAAFSTSINVGRGDPAKPNEVEWETVSKFSRDHSTYKFSIGLGPEPRKSYVWKRTHDTDIKGTKSSKLDRRSWKLIDDATGQVVAVFASDGMNWKKAGSFRFLASGGKDWDEWMLLTCFGVFEKARRRAMARRDWTWFI